MITNFLLKYLQLQYKSGLSNSATVSAVNYLGQTVNAITGYNYYGDLYTFPFRLAQPVGNSEGSWCAFDMTKCSNGSHTYQYYQEGTASINHFGVIFGDGDDTPTPDDYCLSGNMFTTFTASTVWQTTIKDGHVVITAAYTLTNTGSSSFTVREVALTRATDRSTSSTNNQYILCTHDLLDDPVTIAPGETKVVTYQLKLY